LQVEYVHPHCCPAVNRSASHGAQIKPDGVQRGLVGEIIGRFERKGFTLRALRLRSVPRQLAEEHYKDLRERPFFPDLVDYITSGPVVAMARLVHEPRQR